MYGIITNLLLAGEHMISSFFSVQKYKLCAGLLAACLFCASGQIYGQTRIIKPDSKPFKKPALKFNTGKSGQAGTSYIISPDRSKHIDPTLSSKPATPKHSGSPAGINDIRFQLKKSEQEQSASDSKMDSGEIAINFEAVDLMSLVRYLSQETGRAFIINQPLKGDVTIISPITLSRDEALAMLESILQVRGYTAVPSGKMFKIVSLNEAKVAGTETRTSFEIDSLTEDDTLITQIVPLLRTSVKEAQAILANLLPRDCSMLVFPPSNTIVLTGRSVSIKRAFEVLKELEKGLLKPGLDIVPLKFSIAADLKNQLEKIISSGGVERDEIKGGVTFIADKRSNSLLVLTSPENFVRVRTLIDRLDSSTSDSRPELTHFFKLKFADETDTVTQLEEILGFGNSKQVKSASETAAIETTRLVPIKRTRQIMVTTRSEAIMKKIGQLLEHLDVPPTEDSSDIKVIRVVNAEAKVLADTLSRLVKQRNSNAGAISSKEKIDFVAEEHTNSVIMTGPPQLFAHYEKILKELDVMRAQILVEVLISEVSGNLTHSMGIEWNVFDFNSDKWRAFGGTNYDLRGQKPLGNSGFQIGLIKDAIDVAKLGDGDISELSKIKAMVKAYRNNSNFKILSAPQILTTDNEEAKLSVGEIVALPQGFTKDRDSGRFDLTNFKYEDVGIILGLTPRVNSKNLVSLKINQEIKKRQEENLYDFNVPVLTKRQMETTVTIPNHKTIVIGGLMKEDKTKVVEQVPILSKIPFIGEAFKNKKTVTQKTNLLVFITPHILSSPEEVVNFDRKQKEKPESFENKKKAALSKLEKRRKQMRERAKKAFEHLRKRTAN